MFCQLFVLNPENVDNSTFKFSRLYCPTIMNGDQIVFRNYASDIINGCRMFLPELAEEPYQTLLVVADGWIVLGVVGSQQLAQYFELVLAQKFRKNFLAPPRLLEVSLDVHGLVMLALHVFQQCFVVAFFYVAWDLLDTLPGRVEKP
jgi:hypothetical protein